jgi:hypothetical protein
MRELTASESYLVGGGSEVDVSCCTLNFFGVEVSFEGFQFSFDLSETSISDPMDHKLQIGPEYQTVADEEAK